MYHAAIIVNRRAGAGPERADAHARQLEQRLRTFGGVSTVIDFDPRLVDGDKTKRPRWRARLEQRLNEGVDRAFVLGGDGTVLAVASVLLGRDVALGIVPLGTANLLARDLNIPQSPSEAVDALAAAATQPNLLRIDVGRVNGTLFLCASMLGMSTQLATVRERTRGSGVLRSWTQMASATWRLLRSYPYKRIRLSAHGESLTFKTRALIVSNNPVDGELRPLPRRPRLDTGELGVYGLHQAQLREVPRLVWRLFHGSWPRDPRLFHYTAAAVTIDTWGHRKVTLLNDGERLRLKTPLHYELLPRALKVLVPAAAQASDAATVGAGALDAASSA